MAKSTGEVIGLPGRTPWIRALLPLEQKTARQSHMLLNTLMGDPLVLKTAADNNNCRDKITILSGYDFEVDIS